MKNYLIKSDISLDQQAITFYSKKYYGNMIKYYGKKYMKIEFNFDDNSPLKKSLELPNMTVVVESVFYESNKY